MSIADWQRRFFAQPRVWYTVDQDGYPDNMYESKEAAEVEVAWRRALGDRVSIQSQNIHSMELARERWQPSDEKGSGR